MTARKKTSKTRPAKKPPAARKKPAKKAAPAPAKKATKKPSAKATPAPAKKAEKSRVGVEAVTLGHVFALRPKVNTSFPQAEFLKAKRALSDERYGSLEEAARALAERALADTNRKPTKHSLRRR